MDKDLILEILDAAVEYGIPAVKETIQAYQKDVITSEDINQLKEGIKKPEEYFK